jgi:hypothetical protein
VLDVTVSRDDSPSPKLLLSATVSDPTKVDTLAMTIDQLQTIQPGEIWNCPDESVGQPMVTFTFRAAAGTPALATATVPDSATAPATACNLMTLTIHGRTRTPLVGGAAVVRETQALLGTSLTRPG